MKRIRLLIVDGSSTARHTLSRLFDQHREFEIVAAVASGRMALAKLQDLHPDVVVLDVARPDMEGLKTLATIRETHPALPVIMFSRLTERGSQTTVDALLLGATGYVTKPESNADFERCVQGELTTKIKSSGTRQHKPIPPSVTTSIREGEVSSGLQDSPTVTKSRSAGASASREATYNAEIVAIATSTGGPNALATLLSALPPEFVTPIVIVQHMASGFTTSLAESLRRQTGRNVQEVGTVQPLTAAAVWIAPGGRHLVVNRQGVAVQVAPHDDAPEDGCRPSANVLFRSVADVFGPVSLAVVLTGMGNDGLAGCRAIRQAGGTILVQNEASSIAWGMPGQVATAGLADEVLSLTDLPQEICRRTTSTRLQRFSAS